MAQPLTPFYPIWSLKSDGQEVVNQKGKVLRNGPTQEQLDRTPNAQGQSDYYRLIEKDEPKHIDWRKKLGGMLLREIGTKDHEDKWQQCILYDLPEGYRLFEHIKSKASGEAKPVKNHSGGGHDRQDAYLYGYPKGPRKRFRSPVEFFPHLLWLSTDETSDYENCTCRICSPVQLDVEKPAPATSKSDTKPNLAAAATTTTVKRENGPSYAIVPTSTPTLTPSHTPVQIAHNPTVQTPARRPSVGTPIAQSPSIKPAVTSAHQANPPSQPPPRIVQTPLPQPRSIDQQVDAQYAKFIARPGEVVWFFRPKTQAYGLGLLVRRWIPKDRPADRVYLVQPLSHPYNSPPLELELVTSDKYHQNLKPWLAWSAPSCTYLFLQQNPTMTYDEVDWHAVLSGRFGEGVADVDASILASKAIDTTYTLSDLVKTQSVNGVEERYWNVIYFGAEKIWNGEPVRLRMAGGTDILVVKNIVEKTNSGRIQLIGDIYTYATLQVPNPASPPEVPATNNIPLRMREDMRERNRILVPATRTFAYWKLVDTDVTTLSLEDIKGRWYETSILFIDYFKKAVQNGDTSNGSWMNARGDATGVRNAIGTHHPDRVAAFGSAVPKGLHLADGVEAPNEHPRPPHSDLHGIELGMGAPAADASFALDDFMNFDGTEDAGMPFGNGFTL